MAAPRSDPYRIDGIERAIRILCCFDFHQPELSVRDVVSRTGLHKATAHRILMALTRSGFIEKDPITGQYRLGLPLFHLGQVAVSRLTLRDVALPFLLELTEHSQETSHVAVLDGLDVLYVEKVEGPHALRMPSRLGRRIPTYCTSLGKAMLSCLSDDRVRQLFADCSFEPYTPRTVRTVDRLLRDLAIVRRRGWALDDEEIETGLRCIGAPVRDYTGGMVGAISVAAPSARLKGANIARAAQMVKSTAEDIARRLGFGRAGAPPPSTASGSTDGSREGRVRTLGSGKPPLVSDGQVMSIVKRRRSHERVERP
jgi:DNA-binding IclR family transcriptional regulator